MTDFSKYTNSQLDSMYYETVGYHPMKNDGLTREELIKLMTEYEQEGGCFKTTNIESPMINDVLFRPQSEN